MGERGPFREEAGGSLQKGDGARELWAGRLRGLPAGVAL